MDGRIKYLTWKHDYEYHSANYSSGLPCVTMAATQALVWAWVSDPDTGSTVFSNVAGGFDDPLNWDGLTPSAHTDASRESDSTPMLTLTVATGMELTPSYCKQQPKRCTTLQPNQQREPVRGRLNRTPIRAASCSPAQTARSSALSSTMTAATTGST